MEACTSTRQGSLARGIEQREGIDFEDTFARIVKWATIRLLIVLVAQRGWQLLHTDVKTPFVHGDLDEEVYISQPVGFIVQGKST